MNKKEPIRILHVVGAMNRAGTETMLMNIYRNIDRENMQFDFVSYSQEEAHYDKEIEALGGRVIKLSNSKSIKELCSAIKTYGPYEVVHAHTLFNCGIAMLAAKKCGINKRIAHSHTTLDDSSGIIRKLYIKGMRVLINKYSTDILACSKEAGRYLFGDNQINKSKYTYFPNLINYENLLDKPYKEVEQFKIEQGLNDSIVIGHIGTFKESKNHKFLLGITKDLKDKGINAKLLLVGDGGLKENLKSLAKEYGIYDDVKFVGVRDDISTMLHSMDVFVFPSIFEGLGLVLLEAQAAGLHCIVSDAIQPEADLGLGLITKLSLEDSKTIWIKNVLSKQGKKVDKKDKINEVFESNGYTVSSCISKVMNIYNLNFII